MAQEIARAVAERVRRRSTPPKAAEEVDPETLVAYLRGRHHFWKLSPKHFEKALDYFRQAIERSPSFTPAHAGIADAWGGFGYWGRVPAAEAAPRVAEAVRVAEADRSNAEAQVVAGAYHFYYERDWERAESALRRAIHIDPNLAHARIILALYLFTTSRSEEALAEVEVARRLDPLNPGPMYIRGMWLGRCGQLEAARAEGESILEIAPEFVPARALLADLDWLEERPEAIAREQALWRELAPVSSVLGEAEQAEPRDRLLAAARTLAGLAEGDGGPYVQPMKVARLFTHADDIDSAFEWLDRAIDRNDVMQFDHLRLSPGWLPIADEPRFSRLLGRLGIPA
jgi:tetratricopeptide (TPR) repeat protein